MTGVWLMYHDIFTQAAVTEASAGAALYHVSRELFQRQLAAIAAVGIAVWTAAEWLSRRSVGAAADHLVLTFDDGWAGSLTTGVECLADVGLRGTFFVTTANIGKPPFASADELRAAHEAGMEIGTHGVNHGFLADCSAAEIRRELEGSKVRLEDLLGAPVVTGSVPGGAWSPTVARIAEECGYLALCTSRAGLNNADADPFRLRRIAVRGATSAEDVGRYARMSVGREVLRARALELPRRALGRKRYAALRTRLLGDPPASAGPLL
jgi:peptidoglycan/xylan/chitin deacetylase (PgdA/CDA1 family)